MITHRNERREFYAWGHPFGPSFGLPALIAIFFLKVGIMPSTIQLPGSLRTSSWVYARAPVHNTRSQARHSPLYVQIQTYTYRYIQIHDIYVHIHAIRTFLYLAIFFVRYTNETLHFVPPRIGCLSTCAWKQA